MAHYARIENNIVAEVIVASADVIAARDGEWVQTSYNTHGGQHPEGRPLRKNFAGIGYTYDKVRDVFIPPMPPFKCYLDEETCLWVKVEETQ